MKRVGGGAWLEGEDTNVSACNNAPGLIKMSQRPAYAHITQLLQSPAAFSSSSSALWGVGVNRLEINQEDTRHDQHASSLLCRTERICPMDEGVLRTRAKDGSSGDTK